MAHVSVCAVADDPPISDESSPAAEGMCSNGIFMCTICECLYSYGEGEGFEIAKGLPCLTFHGCFMQLLWLEEYGRSQLFI